MNEASTTGPAQILVIRHGEKPVPFGEPSGVDESGSPRAHSLTVRGWQRAGALAPFFSTPPDPAISRPTAIFAPPARGNDGDHGRPFETVMPAAAKLGITIDTRFGLDEEPALVAAVLAAPGCVVISWEHTRIPRIAYAILGDAASVPPAWPDDRYDVVWVFDRAGTSYRFTQRPQLLLAGDRDKCIDDTDFDEG